MKGVYQDPRSGHYCYKFMRKGIQYHKCFPNAKFEDVCGYMVRLQSDLLQNKYDILDPSKDVSLSVIIDEYNDYKKSNYTRPNEFDYVIEAFYKLVGNKQASQVTSADIEKYRLSRKDKVSNSSINREVDNIKKLFSLAVTNRHIKISPCENLEKLRVKNHPPRFLSPEEEQKLLDEANPTLRLIILVALYTGMRQGEILNLKWEHIFFDKGYLIALDTKNGKSRNVYMNDTVKDELYNFPRLSEYVFTNPVTVTKYKNIKKTFAATVKRAGIEKITFHQLRHNTATRMVEQGADIVAVKDILGHSDLNVTQRYAHAIPKHILEAIRTLEAYSSPISRKPEK